jgi:hypothetical protein
MLHSNLVGQLLSGMKRFWAMGMLVTNDRLARLACTEGMRVAKALVLLMANPPRPSAPRASEKWHPGEQIPLRCGSQERDLTGEVAACHRVRTAMALRYKADAIPARQNMQAIKNPLNQRFSGFLVQT